MLLPPMETIDRPFAAAMPGFIDALERAIETSLQKPPLTGPGDRLHDMTWAAVFARVETVWNEVIGSLPVAIKQGD